MLVIDMVQGSDEWLQYRWGKLTGTGVGRALGSPAVKKTYLAELVAQNMTELQSKNLNSDAVQRGIAVEPFARNAVQANTGIVFEEAGVLECSVDPRFIVSPDGVVYNDNGDVVGGVEIKCPNSDTHIKYILSGDVPKEYLGQVYAPFLLSPLVEYWYFVSFDDRNYSVPLYVYRVEREWIESKFSGVEKDRERLAEFLDEVHVVLTELEF